MVAAVDATATVAAAVLDRNALLAGLCDLIGLPYALVNEARRLAAESEILDSFLRRLARPTLQRLRRLLGLFLRYGLPTYLVLGLSLLLVLLLIARVDAALTVVVPAAPILLPV